MRLAVGEPAADGRPDTRRDLRVERVEVERDVDEARARDAVERLLQRALDADPVDLAHREHADARLAQEVLLGGVERADADERDARRVDGRQRSPSWVNDSPARPSAAASGIPCTLPDGLVSGVLRSPCASIQITPPGCARGARETGERAERDRVVAAEHERAGAVASDSATSAASRAQASRISGR